MSELAKGRQSGETEGWLPLENVESHLGIAGVDSTYGFLVSGNYTIFYRMNEQNIYVDRILYGCRDYLRILFGDRLHPDEED